MAVVADGGIPPFRPVPGLPSALTVPLSAVALPVRHLHQDLSNSNTSSHPLAQTPLCSDAETRSGTTPSR